MAEAANSVRILSVLVFCDIDKVKSNQVLGLLKETKRILAQKNINERFSIAELL
jgi:hypothetical protein